MFDRMDRALGAVAFALGLVAVTTSILVAPRPSQNARVDLAVLADLIGRTRSGEDAIYYAQYETSRSDGEREVETSSSVLRRPEVHAVVSGPTLVATYGATTISCTQLEDGPSCLEETGGVADVTRAAVFAELIRSGSYGLSAESAQQIAGEDAACFALVSLTSEPVELLGDHSQLCLSADGIPLRSETSHVGVVDVRTATTVDRTVEDSDVAALLDPFDPQLAGPAPAAPGDDGSAS